MTFRLDSAPDAAPWTRWSYVAGPPLLMLRCDGAGAPATLRDSAGVLSRWDNPLDALRWLEGSCSGGEPGRKRPGSDEMKEPGHPRPGADPPPFQGGWIGYLSYDLGRLFETLPVIATDDLALPLFVFTYHDRVVATDRTRDLSLDCRIDGPDRPPLELPARYRLAPAQPRWNFTRPQYEAAVRRVIDYVTAGDVFQINLSQRVTGGLPAPPPDIDRRLREQFPAWFGAYLDWGDHALLCNSPELFLQVTPTAAGREVITRPIKGTRPRRTGMDLELQASPKDQAELNMIVDLERNDLGRVCRVGSVKVLQARTIETHATVFHGAATVGGVLRDEVSLVDLLAATFPGGSVTGAPKIRAMQIIEELEPCRRGPYCGAIGYISTDGHVQFNIAIRTLIVKADQVHASVGGGIVAESDPADEYRETLVKARALLAALGFENPAAPR